MSYWITICALIFVLLLIIEESIYYFWNRYVFGPNVKRRRKWKRRLSAVLRLIKRSRQKEIHELENEKSSHY